MPSRTAPRRSPLSNLALPPSTASTSLVPATAASQTKRETVPLEPSLAHVCSGRADTSSPLPRPSLASSPRFLFTTQKRLCYPAASISLRGTRTVITLSSLLPLLFSTALPDTSIPPAVAIPPSDSFVPPASRLRFFHFAFPLPPSTFAQSGASSPCPFYRLTFSVHSLSLSQQCCLLTHLPCARYQRPCGPRGGSHGFPALKNVPDRRLPEGNP